MSRGRAGCVVHLPHLECMQQSSLPWHACRQPALLMHAHPPHRPELVGGDADMILAPTFAIMSVLGCRRGGVSEPGSLRAHAKGYLFILSAGSRFRTGCSSTPRPAHPQPPWASPAGTCARTRMALPGTGAWRQSRRRRRAAAAGPVGAGGRACHHKHSTDQVPSKSRIRPRSVWHIKNVVVPELQKRLAGEQAKAAAAQNPSVINNLKEGMAGWQNILKVYNDLNALATEREEELPSYQVQHLAFLQTPQIARLRNLGWSAAGRVLGYVRYRHYMSAVFVASICSWSSRT